MFSTAIKLISIFMNGKSSHTLRSSSISTVPSKLPNIDVPQTPLSAPILVRQQGYFTIDPPVPSGKDTKNSVYSGTQKVSSFSKSGYNQNVSGSTGIGGQIGSKDIGHEGTGSNSSDGRHEVVQLMTKLGLGTSLGTSVRTTNLNITRKFYRFASDNAQVFPWSRGYFSSGPPASFSAQLPAMPGRNAYLGSANIANTSSPFSTDIAMGGIGFTSVADPLGGFFGVSNDISVLLTHIPTVQALSPTAPIAPNLFARVGPAIYIHKVHGKARIVRQPTQNANLDNGAQAMQIKAPTAISYIQHEPIALQTTQTNFGTIPILIAGQQYPQEGYTTGHSDYVNYCDGDGINPMYGPILANDGKTATFWDWGRGNKGGATAGGSSSLAYGGPISTDTFKYVHRTPEIQTKIYSHYHKVHELDNSHHTVDATSVQDYFLDGTADPAHTKVTRQQHPGDRVFEVPIDHEFPGKGLKVVYDQQDPSGTLAGINVLRWRYCQDHTGHLWGYTDNTQTAANQVANQTTLTMNFSEYMSYEIWVEFSDVPTQL